MKILITGSRAPAALHLARILRNGGADVTISDSVRYPMGSLTPDPFPVLRYPSPRCSGKEFSKFIVAAVSNEGFDQVIPFCEEAIHLAEGCKDALGEQLMTPSPQAMIRSHDKLAFIEGLKGLGLPALETRKIKPGSEPRDNVVIKARWSRFAETVLVRPSKENVQRLNPNVPWLEQKMAVGKEICATAFCHRGRITAFVSYEPMYRVGNGAGMYFQPCKSDGLREIMAAWAAAHDWHGFLSFDAIEDEGSKIWPIECNPRGTSGVHLFRDGADFISAINGAGCAHPVCKPSALKLGIWASLPKFLRQLGTMRKDLGRATDALGTVGPSSALNSLVLSSEFVGVAFKERVSLISAMTHDIAWEQAEP